ncbi:acetylglutamate kinase [Staphylococcus epidermidis]|uniref:acetylglutamate kinase n=1 Tax=Staphylococcus epidermidis TaxID=1282 RepID=UPI001E38304E|nr:acetylglutamate kinase [Staphylococcus epidermidis]MCD8922718.1 acetylglutamate kinase [Staphylococcus epidermidis]MCD9056558.1 acetylglutamate kinase [Staphylococcus epidermidis]MEB5737226.1 acetylglutamate kinase [Staphylococcus epidermidis]MEB7070439.1 acetylglutamate kinase [Staphylococcus epidermidis]MEB7386760.1 acetylglutamate kinase [Staphylococcus epidermidis]
MKNIIVIKLGGIAIENLNDAFIQQIKAWHLENKKIIIVHGGGQVISDLLTKNNHSTIKIDGMRVTAKNDLPIIYDALINIVGHQLLVRLKESNLEFFQFKEKIKELVSAEFLNKNIYGYVGKVKEINTMLLENIISRDIIPIITSLGVNEQGEYLNVNADHLATAIAKKLKVEKLVYMTDVPGVIEKDKTLATLTIKEAKTKIENKIITGGMIPKIESAIQTVESVVKSILIANNLQKGTIIRGD